MNKVKIDKKKHKFSFNLKKIKKENKNSKVLEKITNFLEIPEELVNSKVKVTMVDNKVIYIEGKNKIDDFDKTYIKIKTDNCTIVVEGNSLDILDAKELELCIEGTIHSVSYIKKGEVS